jgi:hypothetical protein
MLSTGVRPNRLYYLAILEVISGKFIKPLLALIAVNQYDAFLEFFHDSLLIT